MNPTHLGRQTNAGTGRMALEKKRRQGGNAWRFYRDDASRWRWKYVMNGKTVARAYEGFERYRDCIQDARLHGYNGDVDRAQ